MVHDLKMRHIVLHWGKIIRAINRNTIEGHHQLRPYLLILCIFFSLSACFEPFPWNFGSHHPSRNTENTFPLALGGVANDWDLLEIDPDESYQQLRFMSDDTKILQFDIPEGFASYEEAAAAQLIPINAGTTGGYVDAIEDGKSRQLREFRVLIPPQELIAILIGEARGQLYREAWLDESGVVKPESISATGEAIAAVIRNRVEQIRQTGAPSLFAADSDLFYEDPPASEYEAVITAQISDIYQFSPLDPNDPNHDEYLAASRRSNLDEEALLTAYDQALLSSAYVFSEDVADPTGGAFGFYSPTEMQYSLLEAALLSKSKTLPEGAGVSDAQFPAFAPIQVVILSEVATRDDTSDVPAFVFVRGRDMTDEAVVAE